MINFQTSVLKWIRQCFGDKIAMDVNERNHRFLEESLELVQSLGCTKDDAHKLVDYVFDRPIGEPHQEMGGVMVTLAALANCNLLDIESCGDCELERISSPETIEKIRIKQATKPDSSPLPQKVDINLPDIYSKLKWLREEKDIHVFVVPYGDGKSWHIANINTIKDTIKMLWLMPDNKIEEIRSVLYPTYEDAALGGFQVALTLIEK